MFVFIFQSKKDVFLVVVIPGSLPLLSQAIKEIETFNDDRCQEIQKDFLISP